MRSYEENRIRKINSLTELIGYKVTDVYKEEEE